MKRFSMIFAMVAFTLSAVAARYDYKFKDTPVAQALTKIIKDNPDAKITFIYNELEDYKTSATVSTDNLKEALKEIIARNPITMSEKKGNILIEALQKGKYRYSGVLINEYDEPVAHATILLLNPKDSVVLTYAITDKEGAFRIPCDRNPVVAKISSTGYKTRIMNFTDPDLGNLRINTNVIDLNNVNVLADNVRMEPDRTIFVPLQRQKNTSMSGIELLEQMGIPQIQLSNTGSLETLTGKPVKLFIDFLAADGQDLKNMNMQDVKRVEYLEAPTDPRFMGEKYVINFIMEKYIYGGYVKIGAYDSLNIDDPEATGNVRFQYKSMTYDLAAYGQHNDFYHNGTKTTETYRFPQADGSLKTIERLSNTTSSREKQESGRLSFKATYSSTDITARTTISGGITDKPISRQEGDVTYIPEDFPNSSFTSDASKKEKFFNFNGSYFFKLPREFSLTFTPTYILSYTEQNSIYTQNSFQPVINNADDHTSKLSGYLNLNRNFNKAGSLTAYFSGQYDNHRTRYSGSADNYDKTKDQRYKAGLTYSLTSGGFYGEMDFGWIWDINRFNGLTSTTNTPLAELSLSYLLRKKHRFNASFEYSSWAPNASYMSEAIIESNHLMSYTGNPDLKPSPNLSASLAYSWIPSRQGYIQIFGNIWNLFDRFVYDYKPDGNRMIRYISQPLGSYYIIRYGVSSRVYLFNRSLMLSGTLSDYTARNGKPYGYTRSSFGYTFRASYWLRDFYFNASYSGPLTYSDGFMVGDLYKDKCNYYLVAGWANKNWNVRVTAKDFARWNWNSHKQYFTSEYYDRSFLAYDIFRHANLSIAVTYTFNYGKKLRDVGELNTSNSSSSGILRN